MPVRIDLTVATVYALADVHVSEYQDGANAWVTDESTYFTLERSGGQTPDANTIKPSPGSPIAGLDNARWLRNVPPTSGGMALSGTLAARPTATAALNGVTYDAQDEKLLFYCAQTAPGVYNWVQISGAAGSTWLTQTGWFVNPSTGIDTNTGTAATQGAGNIGPLQTLTEFFRRVGANFGNINVAMICSIAGNIPSADAVRTAIAFGPSGSLLLIGTGATTLYTSVAGFTGSTNISRATNAAPTITDTAFPANYATFIATGVRIRATTGASAGAVCTPIKDLTGKSLRITNPNTPTPSSGTFGQTAKTLAIGDQFVVEQLTSIASIAVQIMGDVDSITPPLIFQDLTFTARPQITSPSMLSATAFYGCSLPAIRTTPGAIALINCQIVSTTWAGLPGSLTTILFGVSMGPANILQGADVLIDQGFIVQGGTGIDISGCGNIADMGVFDSSGDGITCEIGVSVLFVAVLGSYALWGSGNTGAGFRTRGGCVASVSAVSAGLTITGASDVKINTTAKTWGQVSAGPGLILSDVAAGTGTTLSGIVVR